MPRFGVNVSWLFTEHEFLDRFAAAAHAGFRAVEFRSPYEHRAGEIAERLAEHALDCILFNLPMGDRERGDFGLACRPGREAEFREGVERAIGYARVLRAPRVNCIVGLALEGEDRRTLEETLAANLRFAARALAHAGVELVVEPVNSHDTPGFLLPRCADAARVIAAVADPNLGLQLDLYHAAMMGDDPMEAFQSHRAIVRHAQFADAPGRGEPGTGRQPLAAWFERLDVLGYEGWLSAEYRPTRPTAQTLAWLRATS